MSNQTPWVCFQGYCGDSTVSVWWTTRHGSFSSRHWKPDLRQGHQAEAHEKEKQKTHSSLIYLKNDWAKNYYMKVLHYFLCEEWITFDVAERYRPERTETVEGLNLAIMDQVCCKHFNVKLTRRPYDEHNAVLIYNPSHSTLNNYNSLNGTMPLQTSLTLQSSMSSKSMLFSIRSSKMLFFVMMLLCTKCRTWKTKYLYGKRVKKIPKSVRCRLDREEQP